MGDYLEKLAANRETGAEHAATAKPRKASSLTGSRKRAKLRSKRVVNTPGKKAGSTTKDSSEKPKMAKKKRSKGRSAAQRRATAKMLRANKARRSGKKATHKRKARKSSGKRKSAKRVAAGKKAARTRKRHKSERKAPKRRSGKRRARKSGSRKTRRSSKRRASAKNVKVVRMPRKASRVVVVTAPPRARRRRGSKRKARKSTKRRSRRISSRSGRKFGYGGGHKAAMENPMDGVELFIGSVTGLVGFATADFVDRLLATHALTGTAAPYTDTPPTTGDYPGLFNAAAICAPMSLTRWAVGLSVAGVPLVIAHFISAPKGRAALQFFGYAAGIRIVGKGLIDAIAMLVQPTQLGQQLYDGEMRAAALKTGNGTISSTVALPSAGLGRPRLGAGAPDCAACAQGKPCTNKRPTGAGYPSYPRETASAPAALTPTTQTQPQPAVPPPAPAANPPAPPAGPNQLQGLPNRNGLNGLPKRSANWGYQE